jgi:membrane-bound serine protease (ClpP class)
MFSRQSRNWLNLCLLLICLLAGFVALLGSGQPIPVHAAGAAIQSVDGKAVDAFYAFLLDPTVVFLLFVVAMMGIYLEIAHPGAILPGVVGAISLLLFLFAAGSLSPNWAGFALMLLSFVLLVLDIQLLTHGALTVGAVISLIIGTLLFFNSGGPYDGAQINPLVVYGVGGLIGLFGLVVVTFAVRAQRHRMKTGAEGMIGSRVVAITPLVPEGRVRYYGEDWAAILDPPATTADVGTVHQVRAVEGLRLHVRPVQEELV